MTRTTILAALLLAAPAALAAQATATPPALGPAPKLVMPKVQQAALPNGMKLLVVPRTEVPLVQATLLIEGGARLDGDRPGLATFTGGMLDEGAGGRDAFALAAELEYLGATLSTGASWDAFTIGLNAPARTFPAALDLMADVVLRPAFAAADVARQRDLRLAAILQGRDRPEAVAQVVFGRTVFPAGHPYHHPLTGDSLTTTALDSAMVREFWTRAADPRRATLILAGDITLAQARQLVAQRFGGWKVPAAPIALRAAAAIPAPPRPATNLVLVDKPGAAQSVILIGAPGVARTSPDYPAITLMNTILGGSFSARLNDILREQKGFTYGANSRYQWRPLAGPFTAGASVRTDVTDSSLAIFFQEFARIRREPVGDDELVRGKNYVVLGALGDFETNAQVAGGLAQLGVFGLPLETIPRDLAAVERLTAADVQRAAQQHLDPSALTVVVVGDLAKVRPGIEALKLGPARVVNVEGR